MSVQTVQKIQKATVETTVFFMKSVFIITLLVVATFMLSMLMAVTS